MGELAPEFQLHDDEGRAAPPLRPAWPFHSRLLLPGRRHARLHQGGMLVSRQRAAFKEADTEVWGLSPQGPASKAAFRAKYGLPFTLLADENHAVAESYAAWGEKKNYGKTYWASCDRASSLGRMAESPACGPG